MTSRDDVKEHARVGAFRRMCGSRISCGQSAVEFAMISVLALAVMLIGVQFAVIGQAALALSQGSAALARYAAVNPSTFGDSFGPGAVPSAAALLLSPTINDGNLQVTVKSFESDGVTPETGTVIPSQDQVNVSLSYTTTNKIFLPSSTLLGITFPATLTAAESQLYE